MGPATVAPASCRLSRGRLGLAAAGATMALPSRSYFRTHGMAADYLPRDSVRYSIVAAERPQVKGRLVQLLDRT